MTRTPPPHILIAGGGVAAVEAVAALRALDAAAALTGGVLPAEWAQRREAWVSAWREGAPA